MPAYPNPAVLADRSAWGIKARAAFGTEHNLSTGQHDAINATLNNHEGRIDTLEAGGGGGGVDTLNELTDVVIASPVTDHVLKYNGTNWVNGTVPGGGGGGTPPYAANFGNGVATSFVITHGLGTDDVLCQIREAASSKEYVGARIQATSTSTVTVLGFSTPPTTNQYRIIILPSGSGSGGGATDLEGLSDVDLTAAAVGDRLYYNGSQWVNRSSGVRDVRDYGAIGDDASHTINSVYGSLAAALTANPSWAAAHALYTFVGTDEVDYAALQSALEDVGTWRTLDLGTLKLHINRTLKLRMTGYRFARRKIRGEGLGEPNWPQMRGALIVQRTDNIPIWETESTSPATASLIDTWTGDFCMEGFSSAFLLQQTSAMTNGIGFHLYSPDNSVAGMFYLSTFRNLSFVRCAYGIKTGGVVSVSPNYSASGMWNCLLENVKFDGIAITAWDNHSITAGGMPVNTINQMGIFNTNRFLRDGTTPLVNTGPALVLHAGEHQFNGLDVEGWYNVMVFGFGGITMGFKGTHVEWHRFTGTFTHLFQVSGGTITVEDMVLSIDEVNVTDHMSVFQVGQDGYLSLDQFTYSFRLPITTGYTALVDPQTQVSGAIEIGSVRSYLTQDNFDFYPCLLGWGYEVAFPTISWKTYGKYVVPVDELQGTSDDVNVTRAFQFAAWARRAITVPFVTDAQGTFVIQFGGRDYFLTQDAVMMTNAYMTGMTWGLKYRGMGKYLTRVVFTPTAEAYLLRNTDDWGGIKFEGIQFYGGNANACFYRGDRQENGYPQQHSWEDCAWGGTWKYGWRISGINNNDTWGWNDCSVSGVWDTFFWSDVDPGGANDQQVFYSLWHTVLHFDSCTYVWRFTVGGALTMNSASMISSSNTTFFKLEGYSHAAGTTHLTVNGVRGELRGSTVKIIDSEWGFGNITFNDCDWAAVAPASGIWETATFRPSGANITWNRCALQGTHAYEYDYAAERIPEVWYNDCQLWDHNEASDFFVTRAVAGGGNVGASAVGHFRNCRGGGTAYSLIMDTDINWQLSIRGTTERKIVKYTDWFGTNPSQAGGGVSTSITKTFPKNAVIVEARIAWDVAIGTAGGNIRFQDGTPTTLVNGTALNAAGSAVTAHGFRHKMHTDPRRNITLMTDAGVTGLAYHGEFEAWVEYIG